MTAKPKGVTNSVGSFRILSKSCWELIPNNSIQRSSDTSIKSSEATTAPTVSLNICCSIGAVKASIRISVSRISSGVSHSANSPVKETSSAFCASFKYAPTVGIFVKASKNAAEPESPVSKVLNAVFIVWALIKIFCSPILLPLTMSPWWIVVVASPYCLPTPDFTSGSSRASMISTIFPAVTFG